VANGAHRCHQELVGRADLGVAHIPGLIILDKRDGERFQIAISAPEHGSKPVH
jgi:hypothetical protein